MSGSVHIAVDLGAESGRVIAGMLEEGKVRLEEVHRFPTKGFPLLGTLRWDIYRIFEEILHGITLCSMQYGQRIVSIGVDAWGVDFTLLDAAGELSMLPYHYRDARTDGTDNLLEEIFGNGVLYQRTGIQQLVINTVNQLAAMSRDHSEHLARGRNLLFIGDLIHYLLCGETYTEYTVASISGLIDTRTKTWDDEIFTALGLEDHIKSTIVEPGTVLGSVHPTICQQTHLPEHTVVIAPAVHDTASAAVSIPATGDSWAYISTGTWVMAGFELPGPVINTQSQEMNISNSGGVFDTSLFLKNTMGLWLIQRCKASWKTNYHTDLSYSQIVEEVRTRGSLRSLLIDPDHPSFLNPDDMVQAIVDYLNAFDGVVIDPLDIAQIAYTVFLSLACKVQYILQSLASVTGKRYERIHAIGGGIHNRLFMQMISDISNTPVVAGPAEASATGNILMQAYGMGELDGIGRIRECVSDSFRLEIYEPLNTMRETYSAFIRHVEGGTNR